MVRPFLDHPVPFGMAHQGGTDVAPGNTVAAFTNAVSLGYTYIETDVHATSDGVLVVFHDDDLTSAGRASVAIEDLSWAEVAQLRVGGEHALPRFDEVVELFPDVRFNVDPKGDSAVEPLIRLIREKGLLERVGVGSFSDRRLGRMREVLGPDLACSPGPRGVAKVLAAAVFWPRWRSPYAALQIPRRVWILPLTGRWLVGRVHRLGLQVHVWTINEEETMQKLLDNGVDAIMSDRISLLASVLERRGHWPAVGS